jgi:ABC-type cobalamin/Fe3+-siderophores transport system ATPase subunit
MIEADGLGMRYPSGRLALDGASLTVAAGELVVILGHNGSGKSTLLRCTAGILKRTSGRVRLLGRDINQLSGRALREARLVVAADGDSRRPEHHPCARVLCRGAWGYRAMPIGARLYLGAAVRDGGRSS